MTTLSPLFAQQASALLDEGRIADAIALCEQGLLAYPDYSTGYKVLARACELSGEPERLVGALERGLKRFPMNKSLSRLLEDTRKAADTSVASAAPAEIEGEPNPGPAPDSQAPDAGGVDNVADEEAASEAPISPDDAPGPAVMEPLPDDAMPADPTPPDTSLAETTLPPEVSAAAVDQAPGAQVEPGHSAAASADQPEYSANLSFTGETEETAGNSLLLENEAGASVAVEEPNASADAPSTESAPPAEFREAPEETESDGSTAETEDSIGKEPAAVADGSWQPVIEPEGESMDEESAPEELPSEEANGSVQPLAAEADHAESEAKGKANRPDTRSHLRIIENLDAPENAQTPWSSKNVRLIPGLEYTTLRFESRRSKNFDSIQNQTEPPAFPDIAYTSEANPADATVSQPAKGEPESSSTAPSAEGKKSLTPLEELARRLEAARIPHTRKSAAESAPAPQKPGSAAAAEEPGEKKAPVVTETLAKIYEMQGAIDEAIKAYDTLAARNPSKTEYYREKQEKLRASRNE